MELEGWLRIVSVVLSLAGMLASIYFAVRARRDATVSRRMQTFALRRGYFSEVRAWADQAVDAMTGAIELCKLDPKQAGNFGTRRHTLLVSLSALADRGRWFFPNVSQEEYGLWKETAYRGFRQPLLDNVLGVYRLLKGLDYQEHVPDREIWEKMDRERRDFVTFVQEYLDPRTLENELTDISRRSVATNTEKPKP